MHTFLDAKLMAKALRAALAERRIDVTHSDSLELVARQFGLANWNILAAKIEALRAAPVLPAGWIVSGGNPDLYRIGIDAEAPGTVQLQRIPGTGDGEDRFATLMQSIDAGAFVGRTLRFSAELRTEDAGRGALWMRVDAAAGGRHLRLDNMQRRSTDGPLEGTAGWLTRSVALDVPEAAGAIHYGVMLSGGGRLWARRVALEAADPTEATDDSPLPRRPTNLGFGARL